MFNFKFLDSFCSYVFKFNFIIFSSLMSNLPLILSSVFFSLDIVVFISGIWGLFISSVCLCIFLILWNTVITVLMFLSLFAGLFSPLLLVVLLFLFACLVIFDWVSYLILPYQVLDMFAFL